MAMTSETRWANAVRGLALIGTLLAVVAGLEARTIRQARTELAELRTEREQAKHDLASAWTQQAVGEVSGALRRLNDLYADPVDGLGRPGGLCAGQTLDDQAIATYAVGVFLTSRAEGRSVDGSLELMRAAISRSDAYKARHK
jgi:hypothetical protein